MRFRKGRYRGEHNVVGGKRKKQDFEQLAVDSLGCRFI